MKVKAIETHYKGYRFRSRTEARWAVFFDAIGLDWTYESEGYNLDEYGLYLPDFTMLDSYGQPVSWIEIKGHRNLNTREYNVAYALSDHLPGAILFGTPELPIYSGPRSDESPLGLFPDGFVPFTPNGAPEPNWDWYKGSWAIEFGQMMNTSRKNLGVEGYVMPVSRLAAWHERSDDGSVYLWVVPAWEPMLLSAYGTGDPWKAGTKQIDTPRLRSAYEAARSARFEYGETPSTTRTK